MKQLLIILTCLFAEFCMLPSMAQKEGKGFEQHIAHTAQMLSLDDATAERFYPVYKQYRQEMRQARQKYPRIRPEKKQDGEGSARLTDEQVKKNLDNSFALSQCILDIRVKYYKEFQKILTPRQIERLYEQEKKEGEHLRDMNKNNKNKKKGTPQRPRK